MPFNLPHYFCKDVPECTLYLCSFFVQIASLSGVGERVVDLRRQRAALDAQEEEAMILQAEVGEWV